MRLSLRHTTLALMFIGCNEPYSVDPNADKPLQIEEVLVRDAAEKGRTSATEKSAFTWSLTQNSPHAFYPSNYPVIRFNKLIDGDTVEDTPKEDLRGELLGNCGMKSDNPIEFIEGGGAPKAPDDLIACYSPSDRLVEVRPRNVAAAVQPAALTFLKYNTDYTINVTSKVKDKRGTAMAAASVPFTVGPFEVLTVTSGPTPDAVLYGSSNGPFGDDTTDTLEVADALFLRILFSGSMVGADAISSLRTAKVIDKKTGQEVSLSREDPETHMMTPVSSLISSKDPHNDPVGGDPRIVMIFPPSFIISDGEEGFAPGQYQLILPLTVTDDGSVMDGKAEPLSSAVTVDFTVE